MTEEPPYERMTAEDATELLLNRSSDFLKMSLPAGAEAYGSILVYRGAWSGDSLIIPRDTLVVFLGDLSLSGALYTEELDYSSQSISELVVAGDVKVADMVVCQQIVIDGDLSVEGVLFADSSGDLELHVSGDLVATTMDARGHHLRVSGDTKAPRSEGFDSLEAARSAVLSAS